MEFIEKSQNGGIKKLTIPELSELSLELREFILDNVSKTGGHLASNLGTVEALVALNYVFDFPVDKIVFDVGHQCYVHKILSGRIDEFKNLRKYGGISGFPKVNESEYDVFNSGHSSNSISVALGIKRSMDLADDNSYVLAFIGDGALTGGMAYEALNDAGRSDSKIIIILNDNEMSISENVGSMAKHLANLRMNSSYLRIKKSTTALISKIPFIGMPLYKCISTFKKFIRFIITRKNSNIFENLGFYYAGPYDGHDIKKLIKAFSTVKNVNKPAVVHIVTKKGKGYEYAENNPELYHGVGSFNITEGIKNSCHKNFSSVFGNEIIEISKKDKRIVAITAAMPEGTGLTDFKESFPERYFDVGIAEGHAVGLAAGLSIGGYIPVFAVYSSFLLRGYDQLLTDVCGMNLHCVFCIDRSGITGEDGETHHGIFDTAYLSLIPNLTIMTPSSYTDLKRMLNSAVNEYNSPCAIKYPRGQEDELTVLFENKITDSFKDKKAVILKEGTDITILCEGSETGDALRASELLEKEGISAEVINLRFLKPLDKETIMKSCEKTKRAVVCECGVKSIYNEIATFADCKISSVSVPDMFIPHGSIKTLKKELGLDEQGIYKKVLKEFFGENKA